MNLLVNLESKVYTAWAEFETFSSHNTIFPLSRNSRKSTILPKTHLLEDVSSLVKRSLFCVLKLFYRTVTPAIQIFYAQGSIPPAEEIRYCKIKILKYPKLQTPKFSGISVAGIFCRKSSTGTVSIMTFGKIKCTQFWIWRSHRCWKASSTHIRFLKITDWARKILTLPGHSASAGSFAQKPTAKQKTLLFFWRPAETVFQKQCHVPYRTLYVNLFLES